ncbi:hypothetical protein [Nitrosomonas sp.]|uniref:hypothetical protein n=1 Tax=Nitrosomonas sp. TaxID=42353 RepID=UPI0025CE5EA6|nr:hypothetical protein [Nitrosomonas sp.]
MIGHPHSRTGERSAVQEVQQMHGLTVTPMIWSPICTITRNCRNICMRCNSTGTGMA